MSPVRSRTQPGLPRGRTSNPVVVEVRTEHMTEQTRPHTDPHTEPRTDGGDEPAAPRAAWRTRAAGGLAGATAALAGLGAAELVAAVHPDLQSPVLDVGDAAVDAAPRPVTRLAIEWFGTADKAALLIGIGAVLALYAIAMGGLATGSRWRWAIAGVAGFGALGAWASVSTRRETDWWAMLPSLLGGAVAVGVLAGLRHVLVRNGMAPGSAPARRRFLTALVGTAAGAALAGVLGRRLSRRFDIADERTDLALAPAGEPLAPAPASVQAPGAAPFFTPNRDFYRIDTALTVPRVSVEGWELSIGGMVRRPQRLTFADLLDRELVEADITMTCVSNEVGGSLVGTARWLGVRLDELLDDAGIDPDADQIVGRSVDGWTSGFPAAVLDGRDAIVAIGMNGEPLPAEHGYPARLVVPGLYGYVSATKWLTELELTRFDRFDAYWVERDWSADGRIRIQSRIDTPRGLARLPGGPTVVGGVAWAQRRGIDRVELQVDDGEWFDTELATEQTVDTWRQWSYRWDATPGRHTLRVRATERGIAGADAIQTADRSEPFPSGATGHHQIVVIVD
jgi:DMSO/TMAO reductase YedYZ molybdopterin-dependent catalytic subunit